MTDVEAEAVWARLVEGLGAAGLSPRWPGLAEEERGFLNRWLAVDEGDPVPEAVNVLASAPAMELAAAQGEHATVFTYELRLAPEEGMSMHGCDLPLWFRPDAPEFNEEERRAVSKSMFGRDEYGAGLDGLCTGLREAVVRFCQCGEPGRLEVGGGGGAAGGVAWPESRIGRMIARSDSPSVETAKDGVAPSHALLRSLLR